MLAVLTRSRLWRRARSRLGLACRAGSCVRTGQWGAAGSVCTCPPDRR